MSLVLGGSDDGSVPTPNNTQIGGDSDAAVQRRGDTAAMFQKWRGVVQIGPLGAGTAMGWSS